MAHFRCLQSPCVGWRLSVGNGERLLFVNTLSITIKRTYSISLSSTKHSHTPERWHNHSSRSSLLPFITRRSLTVGDVIYPVINGAETSFKVFHDFSHLPWWAVVITSTIILRALLTLPLAVYQSRVLAKMELLIPTLKEYQEAVKHNVIVKCRRANLPVEEANRQFKKAAKRVARDLYTQEGCSPYRVAILPWVQLPLWITLSFALRNMSGVFPGAGRTTSDVVTSLTTEGCLWFQDLTVPDSYYLLPVILVATNLGNIELHALRRQSPSRSRRIFTNSLRILSIAMLVVATQMPAVMTLYWATSSTFGLAQNVLFYFPRVRRKLNIPRTPSESQTPFRDLWSIMKEKSGTFISLQRKALRK